MALPSTIQNRLRLPVVGAPLFIISNPDLVIAQCKAGVVGSFPALNARPEPVLEEWLERITSELAAYDEANPDAPSAPYAVNQIVHGSNARLKHDMDMCVKYEVPIVITSLGAKEWVNEMVKCSGLTSSCFQPPACSLLLGPIENSTIPYFGCFETYCQWRSPHTTYILDCEAINFRICSPS